MPWLHLSIKLYLDSMPSTMTTTTERLSGEQIVELCRRHTLFEWSAQAAVDPIPVERSKGVYFWTPEGKRFIDFNSQLMCVNIGHGDAQGRSAQVGRRTWNSRRLSHSRLLPRHSKRLGHGRRRTRAYRRSVGARRTDDCRCDHRRTSCRNQRYPDSA